MTNYINILEEAVDIAFIKKEKAKADWLENCANLKKFLKLHDAYMEYKAATEKWLSHNIATK